MDIVKEKAYKKILPYVKQIEKNTLKGPISLHLVITDHCVNKCEMCNHWKTSNKKILSLEAIQRIWMSMNFYDGESVCLTGGDPVLHPQFNEILNLNRNFDLGFITTGNYQDNFDYNLLNNVAWVRYSVDSLDAYTYEQIRGRDNLYETIIPNIKKSLKYNSKVGINFTLQRLNSGDIKEIIDFSRSNDIYRLIIYPVHGEGDFSLTDDQIKEALYQLYRSVNKWSKIPENNIEFLIESLEQSLKNKNDVRDELFNELPCMINKIHLAIGSDGRVFPCESCLDDTDSYGERRLWVDKFELQDKYISVNKIEILNDIGNINNESLNSIWKSNLKMSFKCDKCKLCWSRYKPIIEAYHENKGKKVFI